MLSGKSDPKLVLFTANCGIFPLERARGWSASMLGMALEYLFLLKKF